MPNLPTGGAAARGRGPGNGAGAFLAPGLAADAGAAGVPGFGGMAQAAPGLPPVAGAAPPPFRPPLPNTEDYAGDAPQDDYEPPLDVTELRKQFTDYVTIKQNEISEARRALQYYHGDQWTKEQLDTLQARGQPAITFNRIGRKIDGLVGVLEKLRGEPKAYGRVENDEHGAELATQCVRYALDACRWPPQETEAMRKGACTGIVVAELGLVQGDKNDPDIDIAAVDVTTFFYDPRSLKLDFSDCRFMGVSKLMTQDELEEMFEGKWDEAMGSVDDTGETLFDNDRYFLWSQGRSKLRLVEHWYRAKGDWHFAFYAGSELLQAGLSPFFDEKGKTISRYDAFAVHVDIEGDHYGFVRNLIGPQDAMNQHRSKSVHIMNTRQLIVDRSALGGDTPDIETLRREAARPDGVILYDGDPGKVRIEQAAQEFLQQTQYFQDARQEIETFGPNPALASGGGPADVSGRSLAMQQQSGIAELGPFLSQWRGWKLRLYRKIFVQQQRNWTAERVLRVTSDQGAAQYVAINKVAADEWGRPILVNAIGQLDVDILVDEGPDSVNVMGDVNDTLLALAHNNVPVPPALIIETSSLPQSKKEELKQMLSAPPPPDPAALAEKQAALDAVKAKTARDMASAAKTQAEIGKTPAEIANNEADAKEKLATAVHKLALAHHETRRAHATETGTALDVMGVVGNGTDALPQGPGGNAASVQAASLQGPSLDPRALMPAALQAQAGTRPRPSPGGAPPGAGVPPAALNAMAQGAPVAPGGPPPAAPNAQAALQAALAAQAAGSPATAQLPEPPLPGGNAPAAAGMPPAALAALAGASQAAPQGLPPLPGGPPQVPPGYGAPRQQPPIGGARLARDGNYYVYAPHGSGNWRKVTRTP